MRQPIRAVGIVIKDNKVLLIHRFNEGREYYVFPGGGVEENESVEEAVLRELREETSILVKITKLLYHHHIVGDVTDSDQYFYLCDYLSGAPRLNPGNETEEMKAGKSSYNPLWFLIADLPKALIYPLEIRDWLIEDLSCGFSDKPKEATFKISELRKI